MNWRGHVNGSMLGQSSNTNNAGKRLEVNAVEINNTGRYRFGAVLLEEDGHIADIDIKEFANAYDTDIVGALSMLEILIKNSGNKKDGYYSELCDLIDKIAADLDIEIFCK